MNKTPLITVFDDKTEAVGKLIQLLENRLYKPLVDAIHGKDLLWLEQNYKTSRRFYYINQELNQFVGDHDIKDEADVEQNGRNRHDHQHYEQKDRDGQSTALYAVQPDRKIGAAH